MEEDYSGEFRKPWNNDYWKNGNHIREPSPDRNFIAEGWTPRCPIDEFEYSTSPSKYNESENVQESTVALSDQNGDEEFILFCLERKHLFSEN